MQAYEEKDLFLTEKGIPFSAFINKGNMDVQYHWHNHFELLFIIQGTGFVTIGSDIFNVTKGDFLIIHSNEIHHVKKGEWEILVIQFKPSMISSNYTELYESNYFISFIQKKILYLNHIHLQKNDDVLANLLVDTLDEFSLKQPGYELNIKGNIYKIFAWLLRREYIILPGSGSLKEPDISNLKNVLDFVQEHYCDKITDEMAAKISHMSYHHFCRTFKKATGRTFLEYVHFVRLSEAEKLLALTNMSVSEIAVEVGFSNCSHFSRLFKRSKGISPLSYRKAQTNKI